jgi:hypothetical protein
MILDSLLLFTGASGNTDLPTTGTQTATNILDLGITAGIPSSVNGGGARDIGVGFCPTLKLLFEVVTAFASGTSLQLQLQGAVDNGSGAPSGTWTTMWTSPAILEANLTQGAYLANIDVPRVIPGQALPRFLRMQYINVGTHTAGAVEGGIIIDQMFQPEGTAGNLSGYPAGITVSN